MIRPTGILLAALQAASFDQRFRDFSVLEVLQLIRAQKLDVVVIFTTACGSEQVACAGGHPFIDDLTISVLRHSRRPRGRG